LRTNRPRNHPPFVIVDPGDCQRLFRRPSRRAPRLAPRGTAQHCRTVPQRRLNVSDRLPGSLADSTPESILATLPGTFRPRSQGGASGFDSQSIAANDCPNGPATLPQRFWPGFRGAYPTRIPNRFPQRCRERFDRSRGEPPDSIPIDCRQRLPERSRNIASNVSDRLPGSLSDSNPDRFPQRCRERSDRQYGVSGIITTYQKTGVFSHCNSLGGSGGQCPCCNKRLFPDTYLRPQIESRDIPAGIRNYYLRNQADSLVGD
jgi:hypothetical protein